MSSTQTETIERALAEAMSVRYLAPGMATVLSESGAAYVVDTHTDTCDCPASMYSDSNDPCKHSQRARLENVLGSEFGFPTFDDREHPQNHEELLQ